MKKRGKSFYLSNTLSEYLLFHSFVFLYNKKAGKQTNRKNRSIVITKLKGLMEEKLFYFISHNGHRHSYPSTKIDYYFCQVENCH